MAGFGTGATDKPIRLAALLQDPKLLAYPPEMRRAQAEHIRLQSATSQASALVYSVGDVDFDLSLQRAELHYGETEEDRGLPPAERVFRMQAQWHLEDNSIDVRKNVPQQLAAVLRQWADKLLKAAEQVDAEELPEFNPMPKLFAIENEDGRTAENVSTSYRELVEECWKLDGEGWDIVPKPLTSDPWNAAWLHSLTELASLQVTRNDSIFVKLADEFRVVGASDGKTKYETPFERAAQLYVACRPRGELQVISIETGEVIPAIGPAGFPEYEFAEVWHD